MEGTISLEHIETQIRQPSIIVGQMTVELPEHYECSWLNPATWHKKVNSVHNQDIHK